MRGVLGIVLSGVKFYWPVPLADIERHQPRFRQSSRRERDRRIESTIGHGNRSAGRNGFNIDHHKAAFACSRRALVQEECSLGEGKTVPTTEIEIIPLRRNNRGAPD